MGSTYLASLAPRKCDLNSEIRKILVLRFSSLGDIVMATAMIRCLRHKFPHAQIDMVVRDDFFELISHNPHLDRKIGFPRKKGSRALLTLLKELNRERYDLIYDAHRSLRTRFLMPLLLAPRKAYLEKNYFLRSLALTFKFPSLKDRRRMLARYVDPLAKWGVEYDGKGPELFVAPNSLDSALNKTGLAAVTAKTVGLIPSAQWPGKRWPPERFREVLSRLVAETDWQFLVFGGRSDSFCESIVKGFPKDRVVNTQGQLTLSESSALVAQCACVIANDTGLMHVADALSVPSILMLGPTSGELGCLPFHPSSKVLEHKLWCRPCSKNGEAPCIRGHRYCLELTTSEMVVDSTKQLMRLYFNEVSG